MLFGSAIERLDDLHVGTTPVEEGTPHGKPHKPLLLLAAFDLIDEGLASPERIPCSGASMTVANHPAAARPMKTQSSRHSDRFTARFQLVKKHNDHPTNGLALCKNHHWPMDRNLIAPCPDHRWHVSKILDPRRSNGEKELAALSGQSLLLPQEEAFHPDAKGLKWRCDQVVA